MTALGLAGDSQPTALVDADATADRGHGQGGGRLVSEMAAEHQEWLDSQPTSTSCLFCDWAFEGSAGEAREAARAHREAAHPEATVRRACGRGVSAKQFRRGNETPEQREQIALERAEANRRRAEREDAERLAKIERRQRLDALEEMDAGLPESRVEASSPSASGGASPPLSEPELEEEVVQYGNAHTSPVTARWPKEEIIAAIVAHAERTGFVPRSAEWDGPSTDEHPNSAHVSATFGNWGNAVEAAGYPRPLRGGKPIPAAARTGSGREPSGEEGDRPTPAAGAAPAAAEEPPSRPEHEEAPPEPAAEPSQHLVVVKPGLRDPIRTADIPYDAEILEDEARFLRERADALDLIAHGVRTLAAVSRHGRDQEEELAA